MGAATPTTCVVYVLQSQSPWLHHATLEAAQTRALQFATPLAAVFVLEQWDQQIIDDLRQHEVYLSRHNIPLIVLVGQRHEVLSGFMAHTQPIAVFDEPIWGIGAAELAAHPHTWPGTVITIDGLIDLQRAGKLAC